MVVDFITNATAKKKNYSKNKKKSWRKHTDITDIEEILDDVRREERYGGALEEKQNDDLMFLDLGDFDTEEDQKEDDTEKKVQDGKMLFMLDTDPAGRKKQFQDMKTFKPPKQPDNEKPLKCLTLLKGLPGAKAPIKSRSTGGILSTQMKETLQKKVKDPKNIAKSQKKLASIRGSITNKRFYDSEIIFSKKKDVWNDEGADALLKECEKKGVEEQFDKDISTFYKTQRRLAKVKAPGYITQKPSALPAVRIPTGGFSYNPESEEHDKLLNKAANLILNKKNMEKWNYPDAKMLDGSHKLLNTKRGWKRDMVEGLPLIDGKYAMPSKVFRVSLNDEDDITGKITMKSKNVQRNDKKTNKKKNKNTKKKNNNNNNKKEVKKDIKEESEEEGGGGGAVGTIENIAVKIEKQDLDEEEEGSHTNMDGYQLAEEEESEVEEEESKEKNIELVDLDDASVADEEMEEESQEKVGNENKKRKRPQQNKKNGVSKQAKTASSCDQEKELTNKQRKDIIEKLENQKHAKKNKVQAAKITPKKEVKKENESAGDNVQEGKTSGKGKKVTRRSKRKKKNADDQPAEENPKKKVKKKATKVIVSKAKKDGLPKKKQGKKKAQAEKIVNGKKVKVQNGKQVKSKAVKKVQETKTKNKKKKELELRKKEKDAEGDLPAIKKTHEKKTEKQRKKERLKKHKESLKQRQRLLAAYDNKVNLIPSYLEEIEKKEKSVKRNQKKREKQKKEKKFKTNRLAQRRFVEEDMDVSLKHELRGSLRKLTSPGTLSRECVMHFLRRNIIAPEKIYKMPRIKEKKKQTRRCYRERVAMAEELRKKQKLQLSS